MSDYSHFISVDKEVRIGEIYIATIVDILVGKGLVIKFPDDQKGLVPLAEISDAYIDLPTKQFEVGQFVQCKVLQLPVEPTGIPNVASMRLSR